MRIFMGAPFSNDFDQALRAALALDDDHALGALLEAGLDVNAKTHAQHSLAFAAAGSLRPRCLELLASRGADLTAKDEQGRGLASAAVSNFARDSDPQHSNLSALLLTAMEMLHGQSTPATLAARRACVDVLLRHGVDFSEPDERGENAFHHGAQSGSLPCLQAVTAAFARALDAPDDNGRRPAHWAASKSLAGLEFLAHAGADLGATDAAGRTPLDCASRSERPENAAFIQAWVQRQALDESMAPAAACAPSKPARV
jgi:ankyrin repeat protein